MLLSGGIGLCVCPRRGINMRNAEPIIIFAPLLIDILYRNGPIDLQGRICVFSSDKNRHARSPMNEIREWNRSTKDQIYVFYDWGFQNFGKKIEKDRFFIVK